MWLVPNNSTGLQIQVVSPFRFSSCCPGSRTRIPGHELLWVWWTDTINNRKEKGPNTQNCSLGHSGIKEHVGCRDGVKIPWPQRWCGQEKMCPVTRGSPGRSPRPFLGRGCEILDAKVKFGNHTTERATGGCGRMLMKVWGVTGRCLCPHQWKSSPESNELIPEYPVQRK